MPTYNRYDLNKTRYTHRDYDTIKADLIAAIPSLTQEWTSREESDPGIVLIKLMSMFGDTLSYNVDKIALELYLQSVTQKKNLAKILALLGYKMHWYRAARVLAHMRLSSAVDSQNNRSHVLLKPYATVLYAGKIPYTVVSSNPDSTIDIYSSTQAVDVRLVQGMPASVTFTPTALTNNRYYIETANVDETELILTVVSGGRKPSCQLVNNLYLTSSRSIINYEFNVDEYDRPYIQLADDWEDIVDATDTVTFKLQYIITDGSKGNISNNAFNSSTSLTDYKNLIVTNLPNYTKYSYDNSYIDSYNSPGYDPQTVEDAKLDSANYVFTLDTLVTSSDFEKAAKRTEGITLSKLVDGQVIINDNLDIDDIVHRALDNFDSLVIDSEDTEGESSLSPYLVILYLAYQNFDKEQNWYYTSPEAIESPYSLQTAGDPYDLNTEGLRELGFYPYKIAENIEYAVIESLKSLKILNVAVEVGTMKVFPFKVAGTLNLIEPISPQETWQIINEVDEALKTAYYPNLHPMGEKPNIIELVDIIQGADTKIKYFDTTGDIIKWASAINTDPNASNYINKIFDTTSAVMYNGLSDSFTLNSRFLKYTLKNVGISLDREDVQRYQASNSEPGVLNLPSDIGTAYLINYSNAANLSAPVAIPPNTDVTLQLNSVTELKALVEDLNYKAETTLNYRKEVDTDNPVYTDAVLNTETVQYVTLKPYMQLDLFSLDTSDYVFNTLSYNDIEYDISSGMFREISSNTEDETVQAFFTAVNSVNDLTAYRTISVTLTLEEGHTFSDVVEMAVKNYPVDYVLDNQGDISITVQVNNTGLQYVEG